MLFKESKSFRDGKLVKQCAIKMAHVFGQDRVARKFETVSLSHQTIARRISDLGKQDHQNYIIKTKEHSRKLRVFFLGTG